MVCTLKILLYLTLIPTLVCIWGEHYNEDILYFLLHEDSLLEWLSVFVYLMLLIVCFKRSLLHFKSDKLVGLFYFFLMIMLFFAIGEEISWGQRIFNFESSYFFLTHNYQNEINFHNLKIGEVKVNKILSQCATFFLLWYFFVFPWMISRFSFLLSVKERFCLPIATCCERLFIVLQIMLTYGVLSYHRHDEIFEFLIPVFFLYLFLVQYEKSKKIL